MKLALAIPHAPHKPGRTKSLQRLLDLLGVRVPDGIALAPPDAVLRVFSEREPHWQWSKRLWRWGLESGADYLIQLQDDVTVPENFWTIIRAALERNGHDVIGLHGIHPVGRELARMGGRWYRTRAWLMGNGYVLSRSFLAEFLPWVDANEPLARATCEDALINRYCVETGRDVWHPLPSLVAHDLSVPSTWAEQAGELGLDRPENHGHRKATVSYQDFLPKELERADFWDHPGVVRLLTDHLGQQCWFCLEEPAFISSQETGVHIGPSCVAKMVAEAARRMLVR